MGEAKESRYTSADFRKELERLAAEGKSVSEIVKDLGISAETVNTLKQDEKFRIGASAFSSLAGKMRIPDVDVSALRKEFMNIYRHGFVRVAACVPEVRVCDPAFNAVKTIELAGVAQEKKAILAVFPELGISGYSCGDLFFQDALLRSTLDGLRAVADATALTDAAVIVGAPLKVRDALFNCAVVLCGGKIAGVAVKSFPANYREFYELRHFRPARELPVDSIDLCGQKNVPIGADLLFETDGLPGFRLYCEICEDLWTPIPPSSRAALGGATVIANLSASNITTGKDEYRRSLIANQSARCIAGYIYSAAGPGESTTDLAWDGHAMIAENGVMLAETERFSWKPEIAVTDIDVDRLSRDRMIMTSFRGDGDVPAYRTVNLPMRVPTGRIPPVREIPRFPYVPLDPALRGRRCSEICEIQVQGLAKRMKASGVSNLVIGVSGGLDSTQALIVCARTMDALGLPRKNIGAYSMPGFATSTRTRDSATRLMEAFGVDAGEIDIRPACMQMLKDIGHPFATGKQVFDVTFENVQAGQRTSTLFRLANLRRALVVGTGDLSELALGWCTYGVGDHMSHYNVNASVPKTLVQYMIRWAAASDIFGLKASAVLYDILDTEISPELVPGTDSDKPGQSTEAAVGPYELQDFNIYYITRYGFLPSKVAFLAWNAWHDRTIGEWPEILPGTRHQYTLAEIKHWLALFILRFFKLSQFKRSCVPDGPKVGSGGSLSPRGDYRAPSDGEETPWLDDLRNTPDEEP